MYKEWQHPRNNDGTFAIKTGKYVKKKHNQDGLEMVKRWLSYKYSQPNNDVIKEYDAYKGGEQHRPQDNDYFYNIILNDRMYLVMLNQKHRDEIEKFIQGENQDQEQAEKLFDMDFID